MADLHRDLQRKIIEDGLLVIDAESMKDGSLIEHLNFLISHLSSYTFEEILVYARKASLSRLTGSFEERFMRIAVNSKKQERDAVLHAKNKINEILKRRFPQSNSIQMKRFVSMLFIPFYNLEIFANESSSFEDFTERAQSYVQGDTEIDELSSAQERVQLLSKYDNQNDSQLTDDERAALRKEISKLVSVACRADREFQFPPEIEKCFVDYVLFNCCALLLDVFEHSSRSNGLDRPEILYMLNVSNFDLANEAVRAVLGGHNFLYSNGEKCFLLELEVFDKKFECLNRLVAGGTPWDDGDVYLGKSPILLQMARLKLEADLNRYLSSKLKEENSK